MNRALRLLLENVNAMIVLAGFVAFEWGIALHWSGAIAAMIGGAILMAVGTWPYLRPAPRTI